jgi:hypothetical protein
VERDAVISDCGKYRYNLWRRWSAGERIIGWCMLNPSTADALVDDPTVRRCIGFSQDWGYDAMVIVNKYAYRATEPWVLQTIDDPYGPQNGDYLYGAVNLCERIMCAWGIHGGNTAPIQLAAHARLYHLGRTKGGCPKHPLYLPKTTQPELWF